MGISANEKDFYDVSIVDGYNLPLIVAPQGVFGVCNATGCVSDLNTGCPKELQVVNGDNGGVGMVGCRSACEAFGLDQYCCSGKFVNPTTCRPSSYSTIFKIACPRAYSYAFDDDTSTFTCKASDYAIILCPNLTFGPKGGDSGLGF
ncbi:Thaumatin-like protein 1 [Camellia lanceoleosa]|uniref:Thaumatin-like protein 1 n=1 Tax=Camellia lanceoleosa TaxID=1840588 RepID=A0ACC0G209_9ERIC|nr:Thaumatin-like protein 1 [Camellia lanceoleosa]